MMIKTINNLADKEQNKIRNLMDNYFLNLKGELFPKGYFGFEQVLETIIESQLKLRANGLSIDDFVFDIDLETGLTYCIFSHGHYVQPVLVFNIFEGHHLKHLPEEEYLYLDGIYWLRADFEPKDFTKKGLADFAFDFDKVEECFRGWLGSRAYDGKIMLVDLEEHERLTEGYDDYEESLVELLKYRKPDLSKVSEKFVPEEYTIFDEPEDCLEAIQNIKEAWNKEWEENFGESFEDFLNKDSSSSKEEYFEQTEKITFHVENKYCTN